MVGGADDCSPLHPPGRSHLAVCFTPYEHHLRQQHNNIHITCWTLDVSEGAKVRVSCRCEIQRPVSRNWTRLSVVVVGDIFGTRRSGVGSSTREPSSQRKPRETTLPRPTNANATPASSPPHRIIAARTAPHTAPHTTSHCAASIPTHVAHVTVRPPASIGAAAQGVSVSLRQVRPTAALPA